MNFTERTENDIVKLIKEQANQLETPAYIYSTEKVENNYTQLKANLGTPLVVSIKANHCPELLSRTACIFEDGYEVASLGELRLRSGTKQRVFVNTPAYTEKFIEVTSRYNAVLIIDHVAQFDLIERVKRKRAVNNPVLLRVNLDAISKGAEAVPGDHFGMDESGLRQALERAKMLEMKVAGLHVFCGSNNFVKRAHDCVEVISNLVDRVNESLGYELEILNLGGGFPANWASLDIDFAAYRQAIAPLQAKAEVIHESGRGIFGSAGYFLTEVISQKQINHSHFLVCDGGMAQNFLLAKTEHVIRKFDQPIVLSEGQACAPVSYKLVGASCNRDDVIGELKAYSKTLSIGDKVLFKDCGAYNALYTVNKFLALKEYKEYIV